MAGTTTTTKIDDSGNSITEDSIQSAVDKEDSRMNGGTPNDDGHDRITDSHIAKKEKEYDEDGDDTSFNSSDDEAIIERMKLATKKNKKMKSGDAVIDDGHDRNRHDSISASRMENIVIDDDNFHSSDGEAIIDDGHDSISASHMENEDDDDNADSVLNLQQQAKSLHWTEMYQRLVAYNEEHNNTMISKSYKEDPQLANWVSNQRAVHRNKKMMEERKRLLNSIDFAWDLSGKNEIQWEEMYQRLVAYKMEHMNTKVPRTYKEDPQLGHWVANQRTVHRNKKMMEERAHLLNSIGFALEMSMTWEEMYQRLVAYNKVHKHTMVPQKYKENPQLGRWVCTQRTANMNKNMTEERKRLLNSIGFVWELYTKNNKAPWKEMYQRLVGYKKEHKNTNVPYKYNEDTHLGRWVSNQRKAYKKKIMTEERTRLLKSICFVWDLSMKNKAFWEEMYQRLVAYKKEHNHTMVTNLHKEDPQLARWVRTQRAAHRNKKITEERKHLLNSIGFDWGNTIKNITAKHDAL